ncbi:MULTISPECIES: D-2-hydroxyacid dehydrogenase [unclassified Fusibacter]|uniref:D-2-hydroxyacid dehydrogenase n=1 Tax=unclassified Fusibacter TaxID=2624464 RepID=UPI001012E0F6|nr:MULTISPECIES: D-2-hydroxyacid dehydrogenase [unclassified Fusibacter]MCK8059771.1 D-2-hydroxyacid dehydrogenase [Fusibacter sp. A2]NPE21572.1 D-2-hydroxyacid dehydrogenase [Fusibacter sp. A1]RXV61980.1 3-phosphoglycerate dehydrogenase [Fusibacter sp. A1]
MLKILANDGMDKSAAQALRDLGHEVITEYFEGEALVEKLKEVNVLIVRSKTKVREALIDQVAGGTLKLVIRAGVGIDNIDHLYAESKGIAVRNTPNSSSASVAELTIGHMFTLARHLHMANVTMRKGEWNKNAYAGIELGGKTLGLIGFGRIARETAKRAKAIGMDVVYYDLMGDAGVEGFTSMAFDDVLKCADFLSLHIPFFKDKGATISDAQFEIMKDGAYLINCARGGVVDEAALLRALDSGKITAAALDVFEEEPSKNEAIYTHDRISLTPHIGASTAEAQERIGQETVDTITGFFK